MADNKFDDSLFEDKPYDEDLFEDQPYDEELFEAAPESKEEGRATEAFLGGAFSDASMGFMDELKGAVEAGGQLVGVKGLGKEFGEQEFQAPVGFDTENLLKAYREGRDFERERLSELEEEEGKAFTAGEVTGMLGPAVATGGVGALKSLIGSGGKKLLKETAKEGAEKLAKEGLEEATEQTTKQSLKKLAASGAGIGAVGGAGYSEEELLEQPEEVLKDVLAGGAVGGTISAALPGATKIAGKALKKIGKGIKEGTKQVTAVMAGLKKADLDEIIARADDIEGALEYPELQEIILDKSRKVLADIEDFAIQGSAKLSDEKNIGKGILQDRLDKRIAKIVDTADDAAIPHLNKIKESIDNRFEGEFISQKDFQDIVQDTGKRAYRGVSKDAPGAVRKQLRETYNELSGILKEVAPDKYEEYVDNISKRYNLFDQLEKKLGIKADFDEIVLESEDKLRRKIQEVGKETPTTGQKTDIENLINDLEKLQGRKPGEAALSDQLKARRLKGELEKGAGEYSYAARTLVGGALGTVLPGIGHVAGGLAGLASRPLTRAALKKSAPLGRAKVSERATKMVDLITEKGAPLGLSAGLGQGIKAVVDEGSTKKKLDNPEYVSGLIDEFKASQMPGAEKFAEQLEEYKGSGDSQEKRAIQFELSSQPAFRKLLKEYEELKAKKK